MVVYQGGCIPNNKNQNTTKNNKSRWLATDMNFKLLHTGFPITYCQVDCLAWGRDTFYGTTLHPKLKDLIRIRAFNNINWNLHRGGGYLVYMFDGMCRFSGYRFHLFFRGWDIEKGDFSGTYYQNMSKGEIMLDWFIIWSNSCVLENTFHQFFLESGII